MNVKHADKHFDLMQCCKKNKNNVLNNNKNCSGFVISWRIPAETTVKKHTVNSIHTSNQT